MISGRGQHPHPSTQVISASTYNLPHVHQVRNSAEHGQHRVVVGIGPRVDHHLATLACKSGMGLVGMFGTVARKQLMQATLPPEDIEQRWDASAKPPKLTHTLDEVERELVEWRMPAELQPDKEGLK